MNTHKLVSAAVITLLVLIGSACNKDFENRLKPSTTNDTLGISTKSRKVLYIIVDGIRGKAIRSINAPNVSKIARNAIYAYDALSDFNTNTMTNAGAWTSMMTGVTKDKHNVTTENFTGNAISSYPSLFTRFKQTDPNIRTASFAASAAFNANLGNDATIRQTFENNDLSVKNAVKEELKRGDATLVVAQFHSAEAAGQAGDYLETSPAYANAILQLDNYIGELMTALSSRTTFSNENWLVVIASNKGGVIPPDPAVVDLTSYGDATRNNFIVFYNPRFSTLFLPKPDSEKIPYNSNSVNFTFTSSTRPTAIIQNVNSYNFGANGNYTIEFLIKSKAGSYIYPTFLSKRVTSFTGAGWNMFLEGDKWTLNSSVASQAQGGVVSDGKWHKLSAVFDGTNKKVRVYTDGVMNTERDMNSNNMNTSVPFKVGYNAGDGNESADIMINSLQIYNVALSSTQIANYACKTIVAESNPNYARLIGYWPMNEGVGTVLKEKTGRGADLLTGSNAQWQSFNDVSPALCPEISDAFFKMVPNNIDIPFEIYHWMGISIPTQWALDGKAWNPIYSDIKP